MPRHVYIHAGVPVFEWEQTMQEVTVYISPPTEVTSAKQLEVVISHQHLLVSIRGNPPYINAALHDRVVLEDSLWTFDGQELVISLTKVTTGTAWASVLAGVGGLDPLEEKADKEQLLLERFGRENPGFDFSGAEFSGGAEPPSARDFMGGFDHTKIR